MKLKKAAALIAAIAIAIFLAACTGGGTGNLITDESTEEGQTAPVRFASWSPSATLSDAEAGAGFSFPVPSSVNGNEPVGFAFRSGGMIQVSYGKDTSSVEVYLRKSVATEDGDISDDPATPKTVVSVNGFPGKLKAGSAGLTAIIWSQDGYDYAAVFPSGTEQTTLMSVATAVSSGRTGALGSGGDGGESAGISNPWTDCASAAEAAGVSGISISVPPQLEGYEKAYRAAEGLAEVLYSGADDNDIIVMRKGRPSADGDISGVYGSFDSETEADAGGKTVILRAAGEKIFVAIWSDGTYDYSVYVSKGGDRAYILSLAEALS